MKTIHIFIFSIVSILAIICIILLSEKHEKSQEEENRKIAIERDNQINAIGDRVKEISERFERESKKIDDELERKNKAIDANFRLARAKLELAEQLEISAKHETDAHKARLLINRAEKLKAEAEEILQ